MTARTRTMRWLHRLDLAARWAIAYLVVVTPSVVWADNGTGPTHPDGFGNIISPPSSMIPADGRSLFEAVGIDRYSIFTDLGVGDVVEKSASLIYEPLSLVAMLLVRLAIALTWWLERLTDANGLAAGVGSFVQSSASLFNAWLLPTALAVGAGIAYAQARRGESGLSQLLTVACAGLAAVALSLGGASIVKGLDDGRGLLATTVGNGFGASLTTIQEPVQWPTNFNAGTPSTQLARKSGDTIWRTFAVTPWCEVQFGSLDACKRYGAGWLTKATDNDRRTYIDGTIKPGEQGADAPTVLYLQGHDPSLRIVSSIFGVVLAAAASLTIAGLALAALIAWVIALLLLCLAGFFLAIMAIPGKPRQIGTEFISTVVAGVVFSGLVGGVLWATLALSVGAAATATTLGYLPMILVSLIVLVSGWKTKTILEGILYGGTAMRGGHGNRGMSMAGVAAARLGMSAPRKLTRSAGGLALAGLRSVTGMGGGRRRGGGGATATGGGGSAGPLPTTSRTRTGSPRFASLRPQGRTGGSGGGSTTASGGHRAPAGPSSRPMDNPRYNIRRSAPRTGAPTGGSRRVTGADPKDRSGSGRRPGAATPHRSTDGANGSSSATAQPRRSGDAGASPNRSTDGANGSFSATAQPRRSGDAAARPNRRPRFVELRPQPNRVGRPAGRFASGGETFQAADARQRAERGRRPQPPPPSTPRKPSP